MSYRIFFHAIAVSFLNIGLPQELDLFGYWSHSVQAAVQLEVLYLLFIITGKQWNLTCLDLFPCPLTANLQHWNSYIVFCVQSIPKWKASLGRRETCLLLAVLGIGTCLASFASVY